MSNSVLISLIKLNPDIAITIMPFSFCFLSVAIVHHGVIQFHKGFFFFVCFVSFFPHAKRLFETTLYLNKHRNLISVSLGSPFSFFFFSL